MNTCIKICCIQNHAEAALALSLGANWLGFVSAMPSGPGPIPETRIADIVATLPDPACAVLLTSLSDAGAIAAQQQRTGARVLQLCSHLRVDELRELRERLPGILLMPVVHITGRDAFARRNGQTSHAIAAAEELAPYSHALLLDSGSPSADIPVLGGTGMTHDWSVSAEIVRRMQIPVYLAGGLTAENVASAVWTVLPAGVDVCTGVRTGGLLDTRRLQRFIEAVRESSNR